MAVLVRLTASWTNSGTMLGPSWGDVGSMLTSFWLSGVVSEALGLVEMRAKREEYAHFWPLGVILKYPGDLISFSPNGILEPFWGHLGPSWSYLGIDGRSGLGAVWGVGGALEAV